MNISIIALSLAVLGPPAGGDAPVAATAEDKASDSSLAEASETATESAEAQQTVTSDGTETAEAATSEKTSESRERAPDTVAAPAPDPNAAPPKPAPPPDGVGAVGSGVQAPLPPPKPPVDPRTIRTGPWRGTGWLSLGLVLEGHIGGETPARSRVLALGGTGEVGLRVHNLVGIGVGLTRRPHDRIDAVITDEYSGAQVEVRYIGHLSSFDFGILRLFWPSSGRFQPYVDAGGGLAVVEPPEPEDEALVGGQFRATVGFDAWVARTITLGLGLQYRGVFVENSAGHHLGGFAGIGLHW